MTKYKSARALKITLLEKEALIGVMRRLDKNELKHGKNFDMDKWDCGAVHCIGGWADDLYKTNFNTKPSPEALDELFFAYGANIPRGNIDHKKAAKAIKNYLATGHPKWDELT